MPRFALATLLPVAVAIACWIPGLASAQGYVLYPRTHGPEGGYQSCLIDSIEVADFEMSCRLRRSSAMTHYGLVFRYQDPDNLYRLVLRTGQRDFRVEKVIKGQSDYASTPHVRFESVTNQWYRVRLQAIGERVQVWIDDALVYDRDGFGELGSGKVGATVHDAARAEFDDVVVRSVTDDPLTFTDSFDEPELTGWTPAGLPGVEGVWDVQREIDRIPPRTEFETVSEFRAGPAAGENRTMFEFPSLVRFNDGRLFTVFIEENQHGTPSWAAMPSSGRLWCAWSSDVGATWTARAPFIDTPVDDRHCYVTVREDGSLLATFWVQFVAFGGSGILNYTTTSHDGGATWSDPIRWRSPQADWGANCVTGSSSVTVPARRHPDGRLYLAIHTAGKDGQPPTEVGLLWSDDGGRTWGDYVTVAFDPERQICFVEPAIIQTRGGRWIAVMRTEMPITPGTTHPYKLGPTMWCTSEDGVNWTPPAEMPLDNTTSGSTATFLCQTQTGVVVFAVNTGTAFSYDEGETWVPQELQCGYYPVLEELAPGTLASLACEMQGKVLRLTQPTPGEDPKPSQTQPPVLAGPAALPVSRSEAVEGLQVLGRPRAVRVRGAMQPERSDLVRPDAWPLLSVFAAETPAGPCIASVFANGARDAWSEPRLVARTDAAANAIGIGQARDGTLMVTWTSETETGARGWSALSRAGGASWGPPVEIKSEATAEHSCAPGGDPVSLGDGAWLIAVTNRANADQPTVICLKSTDGGSTWASAGTIAAGFIEPAVAVARDGRWIALARKDGTQEVHQFASDDAGKTWTEGRKTRLEGTDPMLTELLETFFVAAAEGDDGYLRGGLSWDNLDTWLTSPIACGHLVRVNGRKHLALGSGTDLAGEYTRLEQVRPDPEEIEQALKLPMRRVPVTDESFSPQGDWKQVTRDGETRIETSAHDSLSVKFSGTAAFLVHDQAPRGHILRITIDGQEYPPVETRGIAGDAKTSCVAVNLPPGEHTLVVTPLLRWMAGTMSIVGIDVAPAE